jgi:predicted Rossmann fold flavoprotein
MRLAVDRSSYILQIWLFHIENAELFLKLENAKDHFINFLDIYFALYDHFLKIGAICPGIWRLYVYTARNAKSCRILIILRYALEKTNIRLLTGFEVQKVKKTDAGFRIDGTEETILCDRLIVACGGLAGTKLGGTMSGYKLLRSLGHRCTKLRPALVQLKSSWNGCASLKGVRTGCDASVYCDGVLHSQSSGELQFTEYGLSGPVIFEVSRDACQGVGRWTCVLDFLPAKDETWLLNQLLVRRNTCWKAEDLLTGILHNRLGRVIVQSIGISSYVPIAQLEEAELAAIARAVKHFEVELTEPMGMDSAQVTAGGILTNDFDPATMESKLVPGLYACGEVLDIDGDCGGYNLQWAWSSGRLAGKAAGGRL